jgi:hypothetical protein
MTFHVSRKRLQIENFHIIFVEFGNTDEQMQGTAVVTLLVAFGWVKCYEDQKS